MVAMPDMTAKKVLIVGATGGIGTALTRQLAAAGAELILAARSADRLGQLASETGGRVLAVDATDYQALEDALADVEQLDGAVNLVGSIVIKPAHLTSIEQWQETLALNLSSAFHLVRASVRCMRQTGGSVVLMSSAAGRVGLVNHDAIGAAKAGVEGLARSAAASYATQGIRINAVAPGLVRTPLSQSLVGSAQGLAVSEALHPLGRIGEPEEVASIVAWLLSDAASWMTGQVVGLDGGMATVRGRVRV